MSDTTTILQALKEHRDETRQDMHELRGAVVKIADAAADMGKTMARSEERHSHHEDSVKRMGQTLDDHALRIRVLEIDSPTAEARQHMTDDMDAVKAQMLTRSSSTTAGWKVLTVTGTIALALVTAGIALINLIQ